MKISYNYCNSFMEAEYYGLFITGIPSNIFPAVFIVYFLIGRVSIHKTGKISDAGRSGRNIILFLASIAFYAWGEPLNVFVMLVSIIVIWLLVWEGYSDFISFYRTDHHWLGTTGLWASKKMSEYLNQQYGYGIDTSLFDPDRFTYKTYKNWYLGSRGKN